MRMKYVQTLIEQDAIKGNGKKRMHLPISSVKLKNLQFFYLL